MSRGVASARAVAAGLIMALAPAAFAQAAGTPAAAARPPDAVPPATAPRPQMDAATAARHDIADYLAEGVPAGGPPWTPAALAGTALPPPTFVVAADGSGTHRTLQAAFDALPAAGTPGVARAVIHVRPGTYRERPCLQGKVPLLLAGDPLDAAAVRIVHGAYHALPKAPGTPAHACQPDLESAQHGTPGSATLVIASDDVQLMHLTVENDAMAGVRAGVGYPEGAGESGGAQAVALMTRADRVQLENVRLLGHQDTLMVRRAAPDRIGRVYLHGSLVAGDVDFVFGNGTLVIDRSTVLSVAGRRTPPNGGHVFAPSTPAAVARGFLVTRSRIVAEPGVAPASISLGRAWDEGVPRHQWQPGNPNGQLLIRDSALGAHLAPWAASTARRPFTTAGPAANRMAEYRNHAEAGDPARAVLAPDDGWASRDGGTRGGADALPSDVHTVRTRAELVAALAAPHRRPRIVQVAARIDLATDDAGRPLGAEAWQDPAFDRAAFERLYDPASWGRRDPAGPLEQARQRSARRQQQHLMLRVPSRTTLIGIAPGAGLVHGGLQLQQVEDVIVRRLHFSDAFDHFPEWQPRDNGHGEWNSLLDNLVLSGARRVWIDHNSFDDGPAPAAPPRTVFGRPQVHHDGLLDIIRGSDLVTVSRNHFRRHDKSILVGNSDGQTLDEGRLRVTFRHNVFEALNERAPRVRFGQVHLQNNLYVVPEGTPFGYSIGLGRQARILAEHNVWQTPAGTAAGALLRALGGSQLADLGSLHNGRPLDLVEAARAAGLVLQPPAFEPPRAAPPDPLAAVAERVRAQAGAAAPAVPD